MNPCLILIQWIISSGWKKNLKNQFVWELTNETNEQFQFVPRSSAAFIEYLIKCYLNVNNEQYLIKQSTTSDAMLFKTHAKCTINRLYTKANRKKISQIRHSLSGVISSQSCTKNRRFYRLINIMQTLKIWFLSVFIHR